MYTEEQEPPATTTSHSRGWEPSLPWYDRIPKAALIAVGVAVFALAALLIWRLTAPASSVGSAPGGADASGDGAPAAGADACLGGGTQPNELDEAVLFARDNAPLTPAGAAEFAATVWRWAGVAPASPRRAELAPLLLDADRIMQPGWATTPDPRRQVGGMDFVGGRYYVEPGASSSEVRLTVQGTSMADGRSETALIYTHLRSQGGKWRVVDTEGQPEPLAVMQASGHSFEGTC